MNISILSVKRGVTVGMIYLMVLGFGMFSLSRLQLDLYPDISFPVVMIITNYTGASPEDMETLITRPIEGIVSSVKGVEEVTSDSKQGASVVQASFDWSADMEQAETEVRRQLELVKGLLPDDADAPMVFAFDPAMQPIVMMMVTGPYPLDKLRDLAETEIEPKLERLDGVATANVAGGLKREIHVVLDPLKVEAFGLDVNAIVGAIYGENVQEPGGSIQQGSLDFTIQTRGKYQSVADIGEVVIGAKQSGQAMVPLRLKEVASVEDSFFESQRILEVDGEPAVWMEVRKQSGENTVQVANRIMELLTDFSKDNAYDIELKILWNQANIINRSLANLSTTAIIAVGISFLVLFFFLRNLRSALIVSAAMPLSVIATFAVMDQASMTLNVLSMAGLALSVGMLVDNAIVVLENIFRLKEEGRSAWESAMEGAAQVGTAVTASTLTTVSVFVPVLFVPGIAGVLFKDMAVTICFALAVSLLVARTFIPFAASRVLGTKRAEKLLTRAQQKDVFSGVRTRYGHILDWVLDHRWVVGLGLGVLIAGTILLIMVLPTDFMAQNDESRIFASVEAPIGNNLQEAHAIVREAQAVLEEVIKPEERTAVALDMGAGEGFTSIFSKGVHAGTFNIPLVAIRERDRSQQEIEQEIRDAMRAIPGVKVTVGPPFNMLGSEGDVEIQLRGHDLETSRQIGLELREKLLARPDMSEVTFSMEDQKPEVRVAFDRKKMAELGLSIGAVSRAISTDFMGRVAGRYAEGGDEYNILVRYGKDHRMDVEELRRMPIVTPSGVSLPLANIAEVSLGLGPVGISRRDQERVTRLNCYLRDTYTDKEGQAARKDLGKSLDSLEKQLKDYPWPEDFTYHIGGSAEDFIKSFSYLGLALLVSILLVYMVMASQFESLRQPFIIIFSVPLAGIGVIVMFSLTQNAMDVSSLIGVIMLVGIAVNNGIVMVDAANQFRAEGYDRKEAIKLASRVRLRPVLLTSATTIMSMVPLAMGIGEGAAAWKGMAQAVIGGLVVATALTLIVVPTMYTLFARKHVKYGKTAPQPEGGAA